MSGECDVWGPPAWRDAVWTFRAKKAPSMQVTQSGWRITVSQVHGWTAAGLPDPSGPTEHNREEETVRLRHVSANTQLASVDR